MSDGDGYHTMDELYEHRHRLFILVLALRREIAWASRVHADGSSYDGWFIAGLDLPAGQVSYHLPDRLWPDVVSLGIARDVPPPWDGHTATDVLDRLAAEVAG